MRRAGVVEDDEADLLANLAKIAREDPDAGVRGAALKRLADPALTQRAAKEDADAGVRSDARALWFDLLSGTHARSPAAAECRRLLRAQDDAALIEHATRNARDEGIRADALARVTRTALLAERATADPSPELRLAALERIDDEALLDRLAERTRKNDKRVSRRARERADALRIARGDTGVANALARSLCERIEKRVRAPEEADAEASIDAQWNAIEARTSDDLRTRYAAARELLRTLREAPAVPAPQTDQPAAAPALETASSAESETAVPAVASEPEPPSDETIETIAASSDAESLLAQARFSASLEAANAKKRLDQEQRKATLQRREAAVADFEKALDDSTIARAHAAHAELSTLRKAHDGEWPPGLQRRIADAERRYAELSRWQHWSDNQRRRQLCESIEQLAGSGLHPDAIATRVREAQTEWSKLDAAEGHAGHAAHGWARRFHAASRTALEPARSYFRKRQELRKTHAQAIATSLEQAAAIPDDSPDWAAIAKARHAIVDALRALDRVDPHDRKTLAKDLKQALSRLDARLSEHHAGIEQAKAALIAEAQALTSGEMPRGAVAAARSLQQRWREIGNGRRDRDQSQWKTFRAAIDAVFAKLDSARAERTARDADAHARAEALCGEIEQLVEAEPPPSRASLARIASEWEALGVRDDALLRRFRTAQSSVRDADLRRERANRRMPYDIWLARYRFCRDAERSAGDADAQRAGWQAMARSDVASASLDSRFETALDRAARPQPAATTEEDDAARDLLVRIEILGGVESPAEDQERRRMLQIERLSARMRGTAATTVQQELNQMLERWTGLVLDSSAFDARLERALAATLETLS
ncbi:MAG TPA: DUF349 domain-containing protein [Rhodanobacteraceae bacterium]|nr:DUF349 domain-containing protein [Rhodanobacteraceae bacterium]